MTYINCILGRLSLTLPDLSCVLHEKGPHLLQTILQNMPFQIVSCMLSYIFARSNNLAKVRKHFVNFFSRKFPRKFKFFTNPYIREEEK